MEHQILQKDGFGAVKEPVYASVCFYLQIHIFLVIVRNGEE